MDELAAKHVLLDVEVIALIALALGVIGYRFSKRIRQSSLIEDPDRYDRLDLVLMLLPALLFIANPILEVLLVKMELNQDEPTEKPKHTLVTLFSNIIFFAFVAVLAIGIMEWVRNRRVVHWFGLKKLALPKIVIWSILGSVFSLLLCAGLIGGISTEYLTRVFGDLEKQEAVQMVENSSSTLYLVVSIIIACVAAPLAEEFVFRGYMYGALKENTSPVFAMVIVGALFATAHGNLPALLPLLAFSVILCITYEITKCLWVPIGIHSLFNATNIVLMLQPELLEK